jgi:hypothetical protein
MTKKELRYKAKQAILNVLTGAGYEFLIEEFGVDDGSAILNEVKAIIDDMADKLYNPPAPRPKQPRKPKAAVTSLDGTVYVKPRKATFAPDASQNPIQRTGRNRP